MQIKVLSVTKRLLPQCPTLTIEGRRKTRRQQKNLTADLGGPSRYSPAGHLHLTEHMERIKGWPTSLHATFPIPTQSPCGQSDASQLTEEDEKTPIHSRQSRTGPESSHYMATCHHHGNTQEPAALASSKCKASPTSHAWDYGDQRENDKSD